jgi:hypothetical protein
MIAEVFPDFFTDFGATVTKNGAAVAGIFDAAYAAAFDMVAGSGPVFRCATSSGVARGDTLVVNGASYTVTVVEPDGTGLSVCRLEAV